MTSPGRQNRQAGYALLLVYAMAATVAIMLYTQLPRVAFEAQRDREQLLIDRGEQYSRAVQLFVRKYNRFPQDVAALENTQNIRFLRRKYRDPMTGKDEWREVHVGPGGVFTDSLVYGPKKKGDQNAPQTFIAEMQQIGGNPTTGTEGVNLATRRRASDQPGAPGDPNAAGQSSGQPSPNGQQVPGNGQQPNAPINGPVMVLPDGRIVPASVTGQAQQPGRGVYSGQQGVPGQPGQSGFPPGVQPPNGFGVQPAGSPQAFNQPGLNQPGSNPQAFNQPGFNPQGFTPPGSNQPGQPIQNGLPNGFQNQPNAPPGAAANLINQILTTPRPGGLSGTGNTGTPIGQSPGGQTIGGGFAGVASKYEQEGIKIYKERTAYNEWEFVYDMTKDATRGGGLPGTPQQTPAGSPQQAPTATPAKP